MVKMVFLVFKKSGLTREQCLAEWSSERHLGLARKIPGVKRYVQNYVTSESTEGAPDGIGEFWFDDAATMNRALNSPETAAGFEDARQFLDLERTTGLTVDEKVIWG